jgi:hypothetical protein
MDFGVQLRVKSSNSDMEFLQPFLPDTPLGFTAVLDFVHLQGFKTRTRLFGNWACFRPQMKGRKTPTLLGPLERASLEGNQYSRRLISFIWEWKQIHFPKRRVLFFNPGRWTKSRTPVNPNVIQHRQNYLNPIDTVLSIMTAPWCINILRKHQDL